MEYEIIKSKRKTISIEVKPDGRVVIKAPLCMSKFAIDLFVRDKRDWIEKTVSKMKEREALEGFVQKLSNDELKALKKEAKKMITPLVEEYAEIMGVIYNRISIRAQTTRWGSCSRDKNLNFNCLLALTPEPVIRYVVVHELCHIKHMDHSKLFWAEVEEYMPDYRVYRKWLKDNGNALIKKL